MLVFFAVGSMVSAFSAASVRLLHALLNSLLGMMFREMLFLFFIGSFIYSIVATVLKERLLRHSRKLYIIHIVVIFCLSNSYFLMGRAHF
jgi:hypothetical protein